MAKTYNELYIKIKNELTGKQIEDSAFEARIILCSCCHKSKEELMRDMSLYTSRELEDEAVSKLNRRLRGEPLAYVVGAWEFYGLPMYVTPDVLIPRIDTEVLADAAIEIAKKNPQKLRVLDLCCGSGCIACAVAAKLDRVNVTAGDVSENALDVCRENMKLNKVTGKVSPVLMDATEWPDIKRFGTFDMIISNPPYIASGEIGNLDVSVREYEPHLALDGGADGLDFYRSIVKRWSLALRLNGYMLLEVGEGQADAVKQLMLDEGFVAVGSRLDTIGVERVVIGKWKDKII